MIQNLRPTSREEAQSLLRQAHENGYSVLATGHGSRMQRSLPDADPDCWLHLQGLKDLIWLDAEDQTCCVEAGMSLQNLQDLLEPHQLQLDVVVPMQTEGTLGGLFLSREKSLTERRCGALRDQVLGATWLMADGSLIQSGARVVKSVAGYDVTRLLLGSRGRLAIAIDFTLRLRPRRKQRYWVEYRQANDPLENHWQDDHELVIPHPMDPSCCLLRFSSRPLCPSVMDERGAAQCDLWLREHLEQIGTGACDPPLPQDSPWLHAIAEACAPGVAHFGARR